MGEAEVIDVNKVAAGTFYGVLVEDLLRRLDAPLSRGERVELIPTKGSLKVMRIRREEVKENRPG